MSTLAEALAPRSDQLNADDLIAGTRVLKITGARIAKDGRETRIILNFEGDQGKPWKPCKTMGRAMVMAWAITDEAQFVGKSVQVYRDPTVKFGDQGEVGGIRVSHMSHIARPVNIKLTVSQGKKGMFTFHPLVTVVPGTDGLTLEQARADMDEAEDLDALKAVWTRKTMAPHREALQEHLDERKAVLAFADNAEGPADSQRGEQHNATSADEQTATSLIAQIADEKTSDALDSLMARTREQVDALPDDLQETVRAAYFARFEKLSK
jgi:hypothetical protein